MKKLTLTFLIGIVSVLVSFGQTSDRKWAFGPDFGVIEYNGDYGNRFFTFNSGYAGGLTIYRYLSPSFDLGLHGFYDRVDYIEGDNNNFFQNSEWTIDPLFFVRPELKYKLNNGYILKESSFIKPFLKAGVGVAYSVSNGIGVNGLETNKSLVNPDVAAGAGIAFALGSSVNLELGSMLNIPFEDEMDLIHDGNPSFDRDNGKNDSYLQHYVGLRIIPGKAKDSDNDGVKDKDDLCPDTPEGVMVDEDGCPIDTDNDGVPDYQDECPTEPGLKEFNGCPDSDGDGVPDKDDLCPDEPGLAIHKGCPDSDGDGVPDKDDRCPDTPKGYEVDRFGCPVDRDRDGIIDSEDDCPDTPGVPELKGCPYDVNTLMAKYGIGTKKILFDFDKSKLKTDGIAALNSIAEALNNHDGFGVELSGHTDSIGTKEYNMGLSERRVNSAADYLLGKGVQKNKIKTMFFGEEKPVEDNSTSEGRAQNRRVDYKLIKMK